MGHASMQRCFDTMNQPTSMFHFENIDGHRHRCFYFNLHH